MVRNGSPGDTGGEGGRASDPLEVMGGSALASIVAVTASWFAAVLFVTAVTCSISWVLTLVPAGRPMMVRSALVLVIFTAICGALYWFLLTVPRVYRFTYAAVLRVVSGRKRPDGT